MIHYESPKSLGLDIDRFKLACASHQVIKWVISSHISNPYFIPYT